MSSAVYWVLTPSQREVKSWVDRWGPAGEGLDHKMLDEFFEGMYSQHKSAIGGSEHICTSAPVQSHHRRCRPRTSP